MNCPELILRKGKFSIFIFIKYVRDDLAFIGLILESSYSKLVGFIKIQPLTSTYMYNVTSCQPSLVNVDSICLILSCVVHFVRFQSQLLVKQVIALAPLTYAKKGSCETESHKARASPTLQVNFSN